MASYETVDGSPEDAAAFAGWVIARESWLLGQLPSYIIELYPEDFLHWRVTRFFYEGFPVVTILDMVGAPRHLMSIAIAGGTEALRGLLDTRMIAHVDAFLDAVMAEQRDDIDANGLVVAA